MRVALVVMPFAAADSPSLAAGLLKASLTEAGIACDVKHFNVTMAAMIGLDAYQKIATKMPSTALAGEWAFAGLAVEGRSDWDTYRDAVLRDPLDGVGRDDEALVRQAEDFAPLLLRLAADSNDWTSYDVVGFTSTFEQTMPAMALAREIRRRSPNTVIVSGGANFEAEMGETLFEHFPSLDYVCTGEGERGFVQLCHSIAAGRREVPPGFIGRENGIGERARPVTLDKLPLPDFHDYFRTVEVTSSLRLSFHPWIPIEASRGCWWGQKAHCTFCGLNGERMAFRAKSPSRVIHEVRTLSHRYGHRWFQFADNILSMDLFDEVCEDWSSDPATPPKFFEVKSGLSREQLVRMRRAGVVSVQAGMESFSTATLRLMRKGVSGALNVAFLRWCREAGIEAHWNLIWGFPGEPLEDYAKQLDLVRCLTHLDPPEVCCEIRMDRFSPNHREWREHGFTAIRPAAAYSHVFPFGEEAIARLASFFDAEQPQAEEARRAAAPLVATCAEWRAAARRGDAGTFAVLPHIAGGWILVDRRSGRSPASRMLGTSEASVLLAFDRPARLDTRASSVDASALGEMCRMGAVIEVDGSLVTIALMPDKFRNEFQTGGNHA